MKDFWTVRRVASALGMKMSDERALTGVSTDTRTLEPGNVFVALRGESFDGHEFISVAIERGAGALVVDDGARATGTGVPVFVVPDTLVALGALARYFRIAWSRPVVAIGGSNGKTTTKELVRAALGAKYPVHATEGNLNNRVGVPLTLLELTEAADIAVIEIGTNMPGEVAMLRDIARPDIAVITNVQEEHLEGLGDLAGVMAEEMSLCDGVEVAIVPVSDAEVVSEARARARMVYTAGLRRGDVCADEAGVGRDGFGWLKFGDVTVDVPAPGPHNVSNALLAMAVARACGVSEKEAATGIASAKLAPMRSSIEPLGAALLVNDAYNANPGSMRAALDLTQAVAGDRPIVLVLGTMRELGARSDALHDEIARRALDTRAAVIGAVGDFAAAMERCAPGDARVIPAADPVSLWPLLEPRLLANATILLKGSRGVRLEQLVPHLRAWADVPNGKGQESQ